MEQQYNIILNNDLVMEAQSRLNNHGIDVNKALSDYLEKIVSEGYNPEKGSQKKSKLTMADLWGICEGKLWTSDDFDEPLEDLKEYME